MSAAQRRVNYLVIAGTVPQRVREIYRLPWGLEHRTAFAALVAAVRATRRVVPDVVRSGGNSALFDLVARTERQRLERSEPTWHMA